MLSRLRSSTIKNVQGLAYELIHKPNFGGWCFLYIIDTALDVCRDVSTDDGITNMIIGLSADCTLLGCFKLL